MDNYNFVTPYYEPISGDWSDDPNAKFYPTGYNILKAPHNHDAFYIVVNGSKYISGKEESISLFVEFMNKPTEDLITIANNAGYEKHIAIFDSKIWDKILDIPYAPLGPVYFMSEFDILVVFYWYMAFYKKYKPEDAYNWMQAAIDTVAYFGKERCLNWVNFYQRFFDNTIHHNAVHNIKKFAKLAGSYDTNHPTLVYSLYSSDQFGGLNNSKAIK